MSTNRLLFDQAFVEGRTTFRPWTVMVSFLGQCAFVGGLVLLPLIFTDVLPMGQLMGKGHLVAPGPPPPPPPAHVKLVPAPKVKAIPRQFDIGKLTAPRAVPDKVAHIEDPVLPPMTQNSGPGVVGSPGGRDGGVWGAGPLDDVLRAVPKYTPPPPPKAAPKEEPKPNAAPQRIRVGGNVQQAKLIHQVRPVYPELAKRARIQGVVKLAAIIGRDGTITGLQVLGGHPLLVPAALEAVKHWRYQATLLNDEPVEVVTNVDVNFILQ